MNSKAQLHFDPSMLENWIAGELVMGRLDGGVIEVRQAGKTAYTSKFGVRTLGGEPVTQDTIYWIASMTKPVVSVAAMKLVEAGKLSLSEPVATFIPGFGTHGVRTASGQIVPTVKPPTIHNLLTHTSGVTYGLFGDDEVHRQYAQAQVYNFRSDNAQMAAQLATLPLLFQPDTVFEYGMSTDLLGRVIEVLTGQGLNDALKDLVLDPLDMRDTTFLPDMDRLAHFPASQIRDSVSPLMGPDLTWWSGGAGLFSTLRDYMRFAQMLLNGGSLNGTIILRGKTVALMSQNHLPENVNYGRYTETLGITAPWRQNGLGFGLGFAVRTSRTNHLAGGLGELLWPGVSGSNFWVDSENDLSVVFLTHAPDHRSEHRIDLRNAVYTGLN